jgi:hypothetical protein
MGSTCTRDRYPANARRCSSCRRRGLRFLASSPSSSLRVALLAQHPRALETKGGNRCERAASCMHDSFPAPRPHAASPVVAEHGPHRHIVLVVLAPAALPFVPEVRMSGRRRGRRDGETSSPMREATHLAPRNVTSAPDGAGRRLPPPLRVAFLARGPHAQETTSGYARPDSSFSVRALPPIVGRVLPHFRAVLVPRPPPVVTAGSSIRKAEVGECRDGEHNLLELRCTRDMRCACSFPRRLQQRYILMAAQPLAGIEAATDDAHGIGDTIFDLNPRCVVPSLSHLVD